MPGWISAEGRYWLPLWPEVEHRRTEYDIEGAILAMRAGGNPDVDALVTESLVEPTDPHEVAELFERQANAR